MIADTLYAKYVEERERGKLLEREYGFVTYRVNEKECFILNMYVSKEFRQEGMARELIADLSEIARGQGCEFLSGNIDLRSYSASDAMLAALRIGFQMVRSDHDVVSIIKELK